MTAIPLTMLMRLKHIYIAYIFFFLSR